MKSSRYFCFVLVLAFVVTSEPSHAGLGRQFFNLTKKVHGSLWVTIYGTGVIPRNTQGFLKLSRNHEGITSTFFGHYPALKSITSHPVLPAATLRSDDKKNNFWVINFVDENGIQSSLSVMLAPGWLSIWELLSGAHTGDIKAISSPFFDFGTHQNIVHFSGDDLKEFNCPVWDKLKGTVNPESIDLWLDMGKTGQRATIPSPSVIQSADGFRFDADRIPNRRLFFMHVNGRGCFDPRVGPFDSFLISNLVGFPVLMTIHSHVPSVFEVRKRPSYSESTVEKVE
ncbi:hypothetical protein ACWJJH_12690 [Endozoicomonadaceae bacterium StTr2]